MSATARIREPYQTTCPVTMEQHSPMSVWSKAKVPLSDRFRQRSRINYESSVDEKHPVHVDEEANPQWKRGQLCWMAQGKCAQDFKDMESELLEELNESRRESFSEISICLFMIGKTSLSAKPVIIISSEDEISRKKAKAAITKTRAFETSNFEIGCLKYLPSGPIHAVAGSHEDSSWDAASADFSRSESRLGESHASSAYYNSELRLRVTGMPIYVKVSAGRSRMATANLVYNRSTYGYLTAAHVLDPWDRSSSSIDNGDEDLGVPFDSDSEDDDYCNEPRSFAGNLVSRSGISTKSSIAFNENNTPLELTTPTASSGPIELESPCPSNLTLLGQLAPGKSLDKSLDYAIITVENTELHQQCEHLSFSKARQTAHVLPIRSESSLAAAYTTHGLVRGKVTDVPILMRLPGSRLFQPVFTFTYEGTIKNGDCGSLVLDTTSKELCGMIIAASERQSIAYMVGAKVLLNDIENAGWHLLSVDENYMDSTEHQDEGTYGHPQTTRSPRAMSPPKTTSQLASSQPQPQPQPEWNVQYQRYLDTFWDATYGRYYWKHHVEGQGWVFFDWVPISDMTPSHTRSDYLQTVTSSPGGSLGYGRGKTIQGSYSPQNPAPSSHYESLDPSFYVRGSRFFEEGKVFSVLFTETAGADNVNGLNPMADYNTSLSPVRYDEHVHTQVRRFIVVKQRREFCFAVPIFSYGNKATTKHGVEPSEHAIAYSVGMQPQLVYGEAPLVKLAIPIVMEEGAAPLVAASRIYFAIHHPIQYNVKVKSLGYVHPDWLPTFLGYWNQENTDSRQDLDVTHNADNTDSG